MPGRTFGEKRVPRSLRGRLSYDEVEMLAELALRLAERNLRMLTPLDRALLEKVGLELEEVKAIRGGYA